VELDVVVRFFTVVRFFLSAVLLLVLLLAVFLAGALFFLILALAAVLLLCTAAGRACSDATAWGVAMKVNVVSITAQSVTEIVLIRATG